MITADQLLAHAVGDYVLQSHWMATEKTRRSVAAALHALIYGLVFLVFHPSTAAWWVIVLTHFAIDRWRLARYVVMAKNLLEPDPVLYRASGTGFPRNTPDWLAVWLLIIVDNTLHVAINGAALRYLP